MLRRTVVFWILWSFTVGAVNCVGYVLMNQPNGERKKKPISQAQCAQLNLMISQQTLEYEIKIEFL